MSTNKKDHENDNDRSGIHQAEGTILGSEETEDEPLTETEWVTVARDLDPVQAEILKGDLGTAGIPVVITGSQIDSFTIYPSVDNAIQVPRKWLEDAQAIVADFKARLEEEGDIDVCSSCGAEVPPDAAVCPSCGEPFTGEVSEDSEDGPDENPEEDGET